MSNKIADCVLRELYSRPIFLLNPDPPAFFLLSFLPAVFRNNS